MFLKGKISLHLSITLILFSVLVSCKIASYKKKFTGDYKSIYPTFIYSVAYYNDSRYSEEIILNNENLIENNSSKKEHEPITIKPRQSVGKDGYSKALYALFDGKDFNQKKGWILLNLSPLNSQIEGCSYINNLFIKEHNDSLWLSFKAKGKNQIRINFGITFSTSPVSGWTDFIGKIDGKVTKYFDVDYCKDFPTNKDLTLNKNRDSYCVFLGQKSILINSASRIQLARSLLKKLNNEFVLNSQPIIWRPIGDIENSLKNLLIKWCKENNIDINNVGINLINEDSDIVIGNRLPQVAKNAVFIFNRDSGNFFNVVISFSEEI